MDVDPEFVFDFDADGLGAGEVDVEGRQVDLKVDDDDVVQDRVLEACADYLPLLAVATSSICGELVLLLDLTIHFITGLRHSPKCLLGG